MFSQLKALSFNGTIYPNLADYFLVKVRYVNLSPAVLASRISSSILVLDFQHWNIQSCWSAGKAITAPNVPTITYSCDQAWIKVESRQTKFNKQHKISLDLGINHYRIFIQKQERYKNVLVTNIPIPSRKKSCGWYIIEMISYIWLLNIQSLVTLYTMAKSSFHKLPSYKPKLKFLMMSLGRE